MSKLDFETLEVDDEKKRFRSFFGTWNNYTTEENNFVLGFKCGYVSCTQEVAPTTGTPHLHFFIYLETAQTLKAMRKKFKGADIRIAKGSADDALNYYDGPVQERGSKPAQGKRKDLDVIKEIVKNGGNMRDVVEVAETYQATRMAEVLLKYWEPKRDFAPEIIWIYGETGTRKTEYAKHLAGPDYYPHRGNCKWWNEYDAHHTVIIDDFRASHCDFVMLLGLTDRYEYTVETKGGTRQFLAKKIIITSAYHPAAVYQLSKDFNENLEQLLRRISRIFSGERLYNGKTELVEEDRKEGCQGCGSCPQEALCETREFTIRQGGERCYDVKEFGECREEDD